MVLEISDTHDRSGIVLTYEKILTKTSEICFVFVITVIIQVKSQRPPRIYLK